MLATLTDEELIRRWREKYPPGKKSLMDFCMRTGLNNGTFNQWIRCGRRCHNSRPFREAVIAYLEGQDIENEAFHAKLQEMRLHPNEERICKYYMMGICGDADICEFTHENPNEKNRKSIEEVRLHLIYSNYSHIYFVDYENSGATPFTKEGHLIYEQSNSAVLLFKTERSNICFPILHSNTFIINSFTFSREAADHEISMEISILDHFMNKDVQFHIITKDHFVAEVIAKIRCFGRVIDNIHISR